MDLVKNKLILYYLVDQEVIDISKSLVKPFTKKEFLDEIEYELKLIILFMDYDETLVLPPTYYFESETCREILNNNKEFLEQGYIKFYSKDLDYKNFVQSKQDDYKIVRKEKKYNKAYYSGKYYGIDNLPIGLALKDLNPGKVAFETWEDIIRNNVKNINLDKHKFKSLIAKTKEQAQKSFTWEGVVKNLYKDNFNSKDVRLTGLREYATSTYLEAHSNHGLSIIIGAKFAHPILTNFKFNNVFRLDLIKKFVKYVDLESTIRGQGNNDLIRAKIRMIYSIQQMLPLIYENKFISESLKTKFRNDFLNVNQLKDFTVVVKSEKIIDYSLLNKKIKKWKFPAYLLIPIGIFTVLFNLSALMYQDENWNLSYKIIKYIDSTKSETIKDTLKILYASFSITLVGIIVGFCYNRLAYSKVEEKKRKVIEELNK